MGYILVHLNQPITKAEGASISPRPPPFMITFIWFAYLLPSHIRANYYKYTRPPGANWSHILLCTSSESVRWDLNGLGYVVGWVFVICCTVSIMVNLIMSTFPSHYRYTFITLTITLLRSTVTQTTTFNQQEYAHRPPVFHCPAPMPRQRPHLHRLNHRRTESNSRSTFHIRVFPPFNPLPHSHDLSFLSRFFFSSQIWDQPQRLRVYPSASSCTSRPACSLPVSPQVMHHGTSF